MLEKKKTTWDYMLHYGALLGLFWVFQYLFYIGEAYWVHFIYFYSLLNVVSALLMYLFYIKYKEQTPELKHTIWRCVGFIVGICFFGSIFDAAIRYAHYTIINPDVFANLSAVGIGAAESMIEMLKENNVFKDLSPEQIAEIKDRQIAIMSQKSPYIISGMISKVFMGFIFSFLIAILTQNRNEKTLK